MIPEAEFLRPAEVPAKAAVSNCPAVIPERMARLPRWRGLPIPWLVPVDSDGVPNFALNNYLRMEEAIHGRLCGQCGQRLEYWVAFLGDVGDCTRGWFTEPPMHVECARYAMSVCPYLNRGIYKDRLAQAEPGTIVFDWTRKTGPRERWGLYITRQYKPFQPLGDGPLIAKAAPAKTLEWFD